MVKKHKESKTAAVHNESAKISCPNCGNNEDFLEVADGVVLTSRFFQNEDGSFSQDGDESEILGEIKFICGDCGTDLTNYHHHFLDMLF